MAANRIGGIVLAVMVVIGVAVILTPRDDGGAGPAAESLPTQLSDVPPATRERINGSTDCEELQVIFDASAEAHDRFSDEEPPDLERMQMHTAIMGAADDRLREVGCYD